MKLVAGHSWQVEQIFLSLRLMLMLPEGRKKKMRKKRPKKQRRKALEEEGATLDRRQDIFERKQSKKTRNKKSVICLINRQEPIKAATSKRIVAKMKPREDCCRVWVSNKGRKLHLAWLATFALFVLLATCNSQLKASTLADFDGKLLVYLIQTHTNSKTIVKERALNHSRAACKWRSCSVRFFCRFLLLKTETTKYNTCYGNYASL